MSRPLTLTETASSMLRLVLLVVVTRRLGRSMTVVPGVVVDTRSAPRHGGMMEEDQTQSGAADEAGNVGGAGGCVHQPHDKLFKVTFSDLEAAAGYFKWRMGPALAGAVDWDSLKLESGSFID